MKKLLLFGATLTLIGCLATETRNPMHRRAGTAGVSSAAVNSSSCAATTSPSVNQSDEDYFQEKSFRWPDDWQQRHPQSPSPQPAPAPHGELY